MDRIVILGCAGTGKSTFARALGAQRGIPVICLDELWPGELQEADVPAFRELVRQAHAGEQWVSDGNFALATFDLRLPRATEIFWVEAPRWLCVVRAIRRVFRQGEPHQLRDLPKVLRFIRGFDRTNRPRIEAAIAEHGPDVPVWHVQWAKSPSVT